MRSFKSSLLGVALLLGAISPAASGGNLQLLLGAGGRGVTPVVVPSPDSSVDFAANAGGGTCASVAACVAITRSGATAWAQNSSGIYSNFTANTLRQTDLGLLSETGSVNIVIHSRDLTITNQLTVTGGSGTFTDGETVTATGGGSGTYVLGESTATLFGIRGGSGTFTGTLTGGSSGATKTISSAAAVWAATNATVARNQTGADNAANAATSVTAGAANATILQAITSVSTLRVPSVLVKRITGNGTLEITVDNGSTLTVLDATNCEAPGVQGVGAAINSGGYVRCMIRAGQTLANPTIGFRIATNGDAFAIDVVQSENIAGGTSPIPTVTASVTRNTDVATASGNLLTAMGGTSGTFVQKLGGFPLVTAGTYRTLGGNGTNSANYFQTSGASSSFRCVVSATLVGTLGSGSMLTGSTLGIAFSGAGRSCAGSGGAVVSDANVVGASTTINIGTASGGSNGQATFTKAVRAWTSTLTNSQLIAATLIP